jgi:ABC-2 type transport system ATP-binding protein
VIEVAGLTKKLFPVGRVLTAVDFQVPAGEVCGLIGPNGAGKTTLLRILATLSRPSSGKARVAGHDVVRRADEVRKRIGYMPDTFGGPKDMRADAYLQFFAHVHKLEWPKSWKVIEDVLRLVDLLHLRNRLIEGLSLGARQRLALARVLLHDPQVLLLDEPVSGLDPTARVEMRELLRELGRMGKTVLISSHVLSDLADLCDRLVILDGGKSIFCGTPAELRERVAPRRSFLVAVEGNGASPLEFLRGQPWVEEVKELKDGQLELFLQDPASPARIPGALVEAGFAITLFQEREVDLEEAFLRILHRKEP